MKNINEFFNNNDLTNLFFENKYGDLSPVADHYEGLNTLIKKTTVYYCSPYLCFGDYDHSCSVERSNVRVFEEMFSESPDILKQNYNYGAEYIYIDICTDNEEIIEVLEGLENYPVIDNDDMSNLEQEMFYEAWENTYKGDFLRMIEKEKDVNYVESNNDEKLLEFFNGLCEKSNICFTVEAGGNVYIDLDRLTIPDILPEFLTVENY